MAQPAQDEPLATDSPVLAWISMGPATQTPHRERRSGPARRAHRGPMRAVETRLGARMTADVAATPGIQRQGDRAGAVDLQERAQARAGQAGADGRYGPVDGQVALRCRHPTDRTRRGAPESRNALAPGAAGSPVELHCRRPQCDEHRGGSPGGFQGAHQGQVTQRRRGGLAARQGDGRRARDCESGVHSVSRALIHRLPPTRPPPTSRLPLLAIAARNPDWTEGPGWTTLSVV